MPAPFYSSKHPVGYLSLHQQADTLAANAQPPCCERPAHGPNPFARPSAAAIAAAATLARPAAGRNYGARTNWLYDVARSPEEGEAELLSSAEDLFPTALEGPLPLLPTSAGLSQSLALDVAVPPGSESQSHKACSTIAHACDQSV